MHWLLDTQQTQNKLTHQDSDMVSLHLVQKISLLQMCVSIASTIQTLQHWVHVHIATVRLQLTLEQEQLNSNSYHSLLSQRELNTSLLIEPFTTILMEHLLDLDKRLGLLLIGNIMTNLNAK